MNRKIRISLQVMSLGLGIAFGFGASQAMAENDEAIKNGNSYQACDFDFECDDYCGGLDTGFCSPRGVCLCPLS